MIELNQTALIVAVGEINAAILPSPERKARKTSHQNQINNQNERKHKAIHAQAHACATTLVAKERVIMPKEVHRTTVQVITQVEGEFRAWGCCITLSKPTINSYVWLGMVGTFFLARGYEGRMQPKTFKLLVLAVESYIQINSVNNIMIERLQLIMAVNMCCGVVPAECRTKHSVYNQVMRLTNISLNPDVLPVEEGRSGQWRTHPNLLVWLKIFWVFLMEFEFVEVNSNGDLLFTEE